MSNLKLPTMTYEKLMVTLTKSPRDKVDLAYATTAEWGTGVNGRQAVIIRHHGNAIACLQEWSMTLSNCGYNSTTTSARLDKILRDNDAPYRMCIRQYLMHIRDAEGTLTHFRDGHLSRVDNDHEYVLHG